MPYIYKGVTNLQKKVYKCICFSKTNYIRQGVTIGCISARNGRIRN